MSDSPWTPAPHESPGGGQGRRALWLLWLGLATLTTLPYVVAQLRPPTGKRFHGAFFYVDDFYQYLSFTEQAARGALVFHNKFNVEPHRPIIVNLEWWAGGVLGALLGGRLVAGFHALWPLTLAALLLAASRLLRLGGLDGGHLLWGVMVVATGGGLGWLRLWQGTPGSHIPDLLMGIYPWHQALLNGHTLVATALLLWTVFYYLEWRAGRRRKIWWISTAWLLGFSRPYDLLVFALIATGLLGLDTVRSRGRGVRWGAVFDLIWLAPIFFYYGLLLSPGSPFRGWDGVQSGDLNPPRFEFLFALLPPALFWLVFQRQAPPDATAREFSDALLIWAGALALIIVFYRAPLMKTFVTSSGAVVLMLAASVTPRRWLPVATALLCPTSGFLLWRVCSPWPESFAPADYFTAVGHLKGVCRPQEFALAPSDLSLMIGGLTPCSVSVGHRGLTPSFPVRVAEGTHFYDPTTTPQWRLAYLQLTGARFVLLPAGKGDWLGPSPPWSRRLSLPLLELWQSTQAPRDPRGSGSDPPTKRLAPQGAQTVDQPFEPGVGSRPSARQPTHRPAQIRLLGSRFAHHCFQPVGRSRPRPALGEPPPLGNPNGRAHDQVQQSQTEEAAGGDRRRVAMGEPRHRGRRGHQEVGIRTAAGQRPENEGRGQPLRAGRPLPIPGASVPGAGTRGFDQARGPVHLQPPHGDDLGQQAEGRQAAGARRRPLLQAGEAAVPGKADAPGCRRSHHPQGLHEGVGRPVRNQG